MITMNRTTRATHRFRGVVAGIAAALMMFGLADLIARAFTPSAAPLLTLGQAIIPLAPPAAIKPVIALFGDNDKLVLVLSTGRKVDADVGHRCRRPGKRRTDGE